MLTQLKAWARVIRRDVHALWLAARDPRTPWHVKVLALGIAAYAMSPIDLIPDFIPVFGLLDEAILLPILIALAVRLVPRKIMAEHRETARNAEARPISRAGALLVVGLWLAGAALMAWWLWPRDAGEAATRAG